jgi:hypothetical protein
MPALIAHPSPDSGRCARVSDPLRRAVWRAHALGSARLLQTLQACDSDAPFTRLYLTRASHSDCGSRDVEIPFLSTVTCNKVWGHITTEIQYKNFLNSLLYDCVQYIRIYRSTRL